MRIGLQEKVNELVQYFEKNRPNARTELSYVNAYELLVAVILSAQCTDKRVNMVTPALFQKFPNVFLLSKSSVEEIFSYIRSISYPNNKAKHLLGMAKMIVKDFRGEVPNSIDDLCKLPGVGRKTANVIASVVFNQQAMAVDTHVFRVAARLGLTKNAKTPLIAEQQLIKNLPHDKLSIAHHWLILHGRYVCIARKPKCEICGIRHLCNYFVKNNSPAKK